MTFFNTLLQPSFQVKNHTNRQEAFDSFLKIPFFQAWDPVVLKIYVECGIYITKDEHTGKEIAKLKMPGILEAVGFAHLISQFEVYERLVDLDERIVLRWVLPGKPGAELGEPGSAKYRVWVRPQNSTNVKIMGGGHLVRFGILLLLLLII